MERDWAAFLSTTKDRSQWPLLEKAAELVDHRDHALDLGPGAGRDTRYLLSQGWHVTAVDSEAQAVALLAELSQENLTIVQSSFQDFPYHHETYELINAQFSLPFVPRDHLDAVFAGIKKALKPDGIFTGQFFGTHDEWNTPGNDMTFLTQEEVDRCLSDMLIVELREEEGIGNTAAGTPKYWHIFHVIARKEPPAPLTRS